MKKIYDVHFLITFSDFLGSIEADSQEEAKKIALDMIAASTKGPNSWLLERLQEYFWGEDFNLELTDTLEVGEIDE